MPETDAEALARARWEARDHRWEWDELAGTFRAYLIGVAEDEMEDSDG